MKKTLFATLLAVSFLSAPAFAAGDAKSGADLFDNNCSDCHSVKEDGGNRKGPNLFGVVGRKTGAVSGFEYSDANRSAGWVWNADTLDHYLTNPKEAIPGTIMKFKGSLSAAERADLIAFLSTLKK
ncbi:MAG TPA: cytochrome c family protein [Candidatus Sulfotelmatobacter sp.]|jgi:cytochrome c|nr:cytochrome c family protein [Candidatus Sulfotelmatobacter sp.]